jgi:hypothetical protein
MAEITRSDLNDSFQRLTSGASTIEDEGTRYTLADLADTLRSTRGRLQEVADTWSQAQLQTQPPEGSVSPNGEDRWSATEAISHVIATQNWY